jgi:hypothetical protein
MVNKSLASTLIVAASTTFGGGFIALNGWAWQIDAIAEDMGGIERRLVLNDKRAIEKELYDLMGFKSAEGEQWKMRDQARLDQLRRDLADAVYELGTSD